MFLSISFLVIWAVLSFFLHVAIHKASHALVVLKYGGKIKSITFLPTNKTGFFRFATVNWEGRLTKEQLFHVLIAPLDGEAMWLLCSGIALHLAFVKSWGLLVAGMLTIECLYSVIDMCNWVYGWIFKRENSDGDMVRKLLNDNK